MKLSLLALAIGLCVAIDGCTATQGQDVATVLTGLCDAGAIVLSMPGAAPICADIGVVEQIIASWNAPKSGAAAARPMTQTDLYQAVKASGKFTPARVH